MLASLVTPQTESLKSVIGVSALSIITILGKSLASGLYSVKVPLNESFKSKPTFPAISIVVLFFIQNPSAALLTFLVKICLIIF
jgi:hypothetical protein